MGDREASLVVVKGGDEGARFVIGSEPSVIGRSRVCEIKVDDDTVSRQHCRLTFDGEQIVLYDLGSSRGVYVNGVLAAKALLDEGDRFEVGGITFEAHISPSDSAA